MMIMYVSHSMTRTGTKVKVLNTQIITREYYCIYE